MLETLTAAMSAQSQNTLSLDATTQTGLDHDVPEIPQKLLCEYCFSRLHSSESCPMAMPILAPPTPQAQLEIDYDFLKVKVDRLTYENNILCYRVNALEHWMRGLQAMLNSVWRSTPIDGGVASPDQELCSYPMPRLDE